MDSLYNKRCWENDIHIPKNQANIVYKNYLKINLRLSGLSKIIFFLIVQCVRNCEEAQIVVVSQPLSCVWPLVTPWTAAFQASLSFVSWSLLKLMSIESVMPSNHLILCLPLLLLPSIFHSIRSFPMSQLFTSGGQSIRSFSISPSNEYSGLISFTINWFDLLAVQGTQECSPTPQFESSLVLSLLYDPTFTSVHDYWKNQFWLDGPLSAKWWLCFLICCPGLS